MEKSQILSQSVTFRQALPVWCKIALLSFGGPAGQIAVMHRVLVEEKKWISENRFLHALNYCMLLPGPEAQQLVTYMGWLLHGTLGGLVSGWLFVLPGFLSILALSITYALYQTTPLAGAVFFGLKAAVLAVVVEAVIRIGKKALKNDVMAGLAAAAFLAIFFLRTPFPLIILLAGAAGFWGGRFCEAKFHILKAHAAGDEGVLDARARQRKPSLARVLCVLGVGLTAWFGPFLLARFFLGPAHVLVQEGVFFSKAAMVTFGGAYAVLAYTAQQAVHVFKWLSPGEMLDGLGLAETTPGPLIQVVQFVGFLGAYRQSAPFSPLWAGVLGSLMTMWVTFTPCFVWIFLGAPFIEKLRENKVLSCALSAITAAVVGVILNLAVWFALHVLFSRGAERNWGWLHAYVPEPGSVDPGAVLIAILAALALLKFKRGMISVLAGAAAFGVAWKLLLGF